MRAVGLKKAGRCEPAVNEGRKGIGEGAKRFWKVEVECVSLFPLLDAVEQESSLNLLPSERQSQLL